MNSLSWLIYLADVCSNVTSISVTVFVAYSMALFIALMALSLEHIKWPLDAVKRHVWVIPVLAVLTAVNPSKDTVYAIAASEYGETLLKSKVANKAELALESWLDKQIQKPNEDKQ